MTHDELERLKKLEDKITAHESRLRLIGKEVAKLIENPVFKLSRKQRMKMVDTFQKLIDANKSNVKFVEKG